MTFLLNNYWMNSNLSLFKFMPMSMTFEFSLSSKSLFSTMSMNIISHFFKILIILNLLGLVPFIPSMTAHMMFSMSVGMILWSSLITQMFTMKPGKSLSSQIPENSPSAISSFLSLVEGVGNTIRPLTLSFRLTANLSAGHIILGMLSSITLVILIINLKKLIFLSPMGVVYLLIWNYNQFSSSFCSYSINFHML